MDAVNCKITSVKELASVRVEQLDRKCEEIVVEVHGHLTSFRNLCGPVNLVVSKAPNCTRTS